MVKDLSQGFTRLSLVCQIVVAKDVVKVVVKTVELLL